MRAHVSGLTREEIGPYLMAAALARSKTVTTEHIQTAKAEIT